MPQILSIKFAENAMPVHYKGLDSDELRRDDYVVAEREGSEDIGLVAGIEWVSREQLKHRRKPYGKVVRKANDDEKETFRKRRAFEQKALSICKERARQLKLPMKISTARLDGKDGRVVFNFTSDQRVDFRQLVRELSTILRARIELWQIGVRDEAKAIDGFGVCGLRTCCSQWMDDFNPINIRMAKSQDIHLPPAKLSGLCGRLLCCLSHEVDQYRDLSKKLKPKGATIEVEGEQGVIIDRNILMQTYVVQLESGGRVNVTSDEMGNVKIPEQMQRMAKVMEAERQVEEKTAEAMRQDTQEAKEDQEKDDKPRGRRRNRGRRGAKDKRAKEKSSSPDKQQSSKQASDDQKQDGEKKKGRGGRRGKRGGRGRNKQGNPEAGANASSPKQDAKPQGKADSDKPKKNRPKGRGGRGRRRKKDGDSPNPNQ